MIIFTNEIRESGRAFQIIFINSVLLNVLNARRATNITTVVTGIHALEGFKMRSLGSSPSLTKLGALGADPT